MKRPPSYSDSFLILPASPVAGRQQRSQSETHMRVELSPPRRGWTPRPLSEEEVAEPLDASRAEAGVAPKRLERCAVFAFQGSLHILFISAFETAFYFLYVNRSENAGILGAINTYYQPLTAGCATSWSNATKTVVEALLMQELNVSAIDAAGASAADSRAAYNQTLLVWSSMYSVIAAGLCGGIAGFVRWKGWHVAWRRVILENILFVMVLGLYEAFFFRTVIYNYETLSTPELSRYIVDGLAICANS